jgi:hypothetical protein
LSGALHDVNGTYNTIGAFNTPAAGALLSGHPDSKVGGSVMAALQIKNIPTGAGDDIKIDGTWAKGDTKERDLDLSFVPVVRDGGRHDRSVRIEQFLRVRCDH